MKHISPILLAILLFALPAAVRSQTHDKDAEANKSLLWRISGKGLKTPSYLFGTMHSLCTEDYFWTDKMEQSLSKCHGVCFEMNLNDPQLKAKVLAGLMKMVMSNMKELVPEEMRGMLENYMSDSLMKDSSLLSSITPAKLNSLSGYGAMPCDSTTSYEEHIMSKALKTSKSVAGLEDVDEGIELLGKVFGSMPMDSLMNMLSGSGGYSEAEKAEYKKMIAFYKKQDIPGLYNYIAQAKDNTLNTDLLLNDRNKKWIPRMTQQMETTSVFFAVGAGHLWGQNGVINLLRQAGYMVIAVR